MCLSTRFPPTQRRHPVQVKPAGTISLLLILAIPCALQVLAIALITFLYLHSSSFGIHLITCPDSAQLAEQNPLQLTDWLSQISLCYSNLRMESPELAQPLFQSLNFFLSTPPSAFLQVANPAIGIASPFPPNHLLIGSLALFWITLTVASTLYLNRKLTKPLLLLSHASQRIAQGEFVPTLSLGRIRELAVLTSSFNLMCSEIQQIRQTSTPLSQSLEPHVAERMQTLEQEIQKRSAIEAVLHQANQDLEQLAFIDGLTELLNRRHFDDRLNQEWQRLQTTGQPLSVILCDIDYFKQYNDTYGHLAGDDCLRKVSRTLQQIGKHPAEVVARYGGEEFTLLLPETTPTRALQIAYDIQAAIKSLQISHRGSPIYPYVTVSLGVASLIPKTIDVPQQLIASADHALYQAKSKGRDCIVFSNREEVTHQPLV